MHREKHRVAVTASLSPSSSSSLVISSFDHLPAFASSSPAPLIPFLIHRTHTGRHNFHRSAAHNGCPRQKQKTLGPRRPPPAPSRGGNTCLPSSRYWYVSLHPVYAHPSPSCICPPPLHPAQDPASFRAGGELRFSLVPDPCCPRHPCPSLRRHRINASTTI